MSARRDFTGWLEEWRRWSETEREAIISEDWHRVSVCQTAKSRVQALIAEKEAATGEKAISSEELRSLVRHLISLEQRNAAELQRLRSKLEAQRRNLAQVERNLRRVGRSYGSRDSNSWQAYS